MKKHLLLIILFILIVMTFFVETKSTIEYDHSNKNIKKEDLVKYEDNNNCKINNELDGKAEKYDYKKVFNKNKIQDVYIDINETNLFYLFENAIDKPKVFINNIKIGDYNLSCSSMKTKGYTTTQDIKFEKIFKQAYEEVYGKKLKDD